MQHSTNTKLPLARAVGIKLSKPLNVLDLTAGFGQDASLLAHLGCSVTLIEQHPIVFALLNDGIKRAQLKKPDLFNRLSPQCVDALSYCQTVLANQSIKKPDVIYYDPMFPVKTKSASNQKPMQLLQSLVGSDHNTAELFTLAQQIAQKRIVVKRPKHAKPVFNSTPDTVIPMVKHRFDVYLQHP